MAGSVNKVILVGNLGKDPECRVAAIDETPERGKTTSYDCRLSEKLPHNWKSNCILCHNTERSALARACKVGRMPNKVTEDDLVRTEACRREEAIRELGLSRATAYRLIKRYRCARTVDVLPERQRGWPKGKLRDEPLRDVLIQEILEREYLKPTRPPLRRVVAHIATACRQQGLPAPTAWARQ